VPRGVEATREEHSAEARNEGSPQQHGRLPDLVVGAKLLKIPWPVHADRAGLARAGTMLARARAIVNRLAAC
jgi:hypothetical protein